MERVASHHYIVLAGHQAVDLGFVGRVFGLSVEDIC
jgi:hypothetical protein